MNAMEYINLGKQFMQWGHYQRAYEFFQNGLELSIKARDTETELTCLGLLTDNFLRVGQLGKAFETAKNMLDKALSLGNQKQIADALGFLGSCFSTVNDFSAAIVSYEQELSIVRKIGDKENESITLGNLVSSYRALSDEQNALRYCRQFVSITQEINDRLGEGMAFLELALLRKRMDKGEALYAIQKAIYIFEELKNPGIQQAREVYRQMVADYEFENKFSSGCNLLNFAHYNEAIQQFEQMLGEARQNKNEIFETALLLSLGAIYGKLNNFQQKEITIAQGFQQLQSVQKTENKIAILNHYGIVLNHIGDYQQAQQVFRNVLELVTTSNNIEQEVFVLVNLANICSKLKDFQMAIYYAELGLTKAQSIGDKKSYVRFLGNLGTYYSEQGNFSKSLEYAELALPLCREIGDEIGEGSQLWNRAHSLANLGRLDEAIRIAQQSLAIRERISDPRAEKVREYLRIWEQSARGTKELFTKALIELAFEENNVKDFIDKGIKSSGEYGYSDTVWLLYYLYQKVLPAEIVDALFDKELFALADLRLPRISRQGVKQSIVAAFIIFGAQIV